MRDAVGDGAPQQGPALYLAYMDAVCGNDFKLTPTDFLARGADPKGKGDFQGCSEFNPVTIFSQEDQLRFDQAVQENDADTLAERNRRNGHNRRVMILVFRKNSHVMPVKWPCPRATEGVDTCKGRFFHDGDQRRGKHVAGVERNFNKTHDTFACRFYQRISTGSPCDGVMYTFRIRLFDRFGRPIPRARYQVELDGEKLPEGTADEHADVFIRTQKVLPKCVVRWSAAPPEDVRPAGPESDSPEIPL
jgi:hypothetical protein